MRQFTGLGLYKKLQRRRGGFRFFGALLCILRLVWDAPMAGVGGNAPFTMIGWNPLSLRQPGRLQANGESDTKFVEVHYAPIVDCEHVSSLELSGDTFGQVLKGLLRPRIFFYLPGSLLEQTFQRDPDGALSHPLGGGTASSRSLLPSCFSFAVAQKYGDAAAPLEETLKRLSSTGLALLCTYAYHHQETSLLESMASTQKRQHTQHQSQAAPPFLLQPPNSYEAAPQIAL